MRTLTKKEIKKVAKEYNVNFGALMAALKKEGNKIDKITRIDIVEALDMYAHDLFYSRADSLDSTVEYLDTNILIKLRKEHMSLRGVK